LKAQGAKMKAESERLNGNREYQMTWESGQSTFIRGGHIIQIMALVFNYAD
jgi:hypothetical protein